VPADPSSSIPSGLTSLCDADLLQQAEPPDLLAYLATIPDPRARAGRRHPLIAILAMAAAAVLGGARSMTAIAEWAADAPQPVRVALGLIAAMDHTTRAVLAQRQVDGAPARSPPSSHCLATWTLLAWWSPQTPSRPTARRRVPGHPTAGPLPVRRQGQPAHPGHPGHPQDP
jgi:DDE_Tnp_1-associated